MKKAIFAVLLLLATTGRAGAQSSCLAYYDTIFNSTHSRGGLINTDSALVDTCSGSSTYRGIYVKQWFNFAFQYGSMLQLPSAPADTILEVSWTAIDTNYSATRSAFQALETKYGSFVLRKLIPNQTDTSEPLQVGAFKIRFLNYVCEDSAFHDLKAVPEIDDTFMQDGVLVPGGIVPSDAALQPNTLGGQIYADHHVETYFPPFASSSTPPYHKLGFQWNLWKIKCPMAWEITMGNPSVFILDNEDFGTEYSSHPDMTGFKVLNIANSDGNPTEALAFSHGMKCMSQAIAAANSYPMIGVAPNCSGIGGGGTVSNIDVNGKGGGILPPQVVFWVGGTYSETSSFTDAVKAGTVVVGAAGNDIPDHSLQLGFSVNDPGYSKPLWYPTDYYSSFDLGGLAIYDTPDPSNPDDDIPAINVTATQDGILYRCAAGGHAPYYDGITETFEGGWNFSTGIDKFNRSTTGATRKAEKDRAYVDITAPGVAIVFAADGTDYVSTPVPGQPPPPTWSEWKYGLDEAGTSLSTPMVAGVVGLMRSINTNLGATGSGIQKMAHTILTFTADKIVDVATNNPIQEFPDGSGYYATGFPSSSTNPVYSHPDFLYNSTTAGTSWQYNYVNQAPNDPLNRSWAQRVGFGEVNAYRAVANSISCTGIHRYNKSLDLTTTFTTGNCQNENSKYLMHFGAWQAPTASPMDTSLVLQSGGKIIPNQSPAWLHLNQGETLLTSFNGSTATLLTVGTNDILAIDGLLIGDSTANHKIAPTSSGGGKILITGYLQNVEIDATATGPVKMDDLIMNGNGGSGHTWSNITINSDNGSTDSSEIYGLVQLQDYAQLNVNGYLTVQPGGEIEMEGNKNFEISSGGHVKMNASTTIASASTQEVIVDNGATLEISGLLPVNVLCEIDVKSGGTLVIDDGADLQLNQFLIEQGGTFTCNPGGRLTLNLALYNYCYGDFNFVGIAGDPRITLTGGVTTCGTVDQFAGIICVGNVASQGNAYMRMQYVDDSDVYMSGRDVPKDLFLNDYFSSSSALTTDFGDQYWYGPASLLYLNNSAVSIAEPAVRDAYLLYCRFFDQAVGATWHFFNGLNTYNLAGLYVNTSAFYNLSTGSETWNCPNASYYTNSFGTNVDPGSGSSVGPLQIGILDHSSGSLYCSNTISNCTLGISADHDMFGSLFDNTFTGYAKTEYCLSTQTSGHYMLRNNTFTAYPLYGIYSLGTGNEVILRDDGALEYGRNTMTSIRPFHSPASADLAKVNSGTFAVACGLNTFGAPSIFQILNLDVPIYSINVGGNNWLGLSPVREHNCLTSGTPLNEAGTSAPDCGSRDDASPPSCGIVCCAVPTDPNPPSAAWFTLDSSSSELRSAATSARGMMLSDTLDPVTRALEARTELWAASLTDSFSTYLPLVLNDYKALLLDPLATPELKSSVWMLKGQLNEMLGLQDSAAVCYDTVIANYHQFVDSVYALWDLQRLGIPDTETLSTDSGEYAFSQREYHDLLAMIDTISAPDTGWGAGKIADGHAEPEVASLQVTVHPNPVAGIVKICVEDLLGGVPVTVDVVNQMGQSVATLYNATPEAELGLCLSLDCAQLPSGIYYADLQTGGFHHAVKFTVEH